MTEFDDYRDAYATIEMTRTDGILELRLHTDGGPLRWSPLPHRELASAFREVARDRRNLVVIITGTGDEFSGPKASRVPFHQQRASDWEQIHAHGVELMDSLLAIPVPVIGAVNGPAYRHCEIALLSDIVVASDTATFQDSAHFIDGLTPGDGIFVMTSAAMGINRSRYFHLTGQTLDARQARDYGLVNEVVAPEAVRPRAWDLARRVAQQRAMVLRHTRLIFTQELRRRMLETVGYGLALEGLDSASAHDLAGRSDDAPPPARG